MTQTLWVAFAGFALGSMQSVLLDWLRERSRHRRQLRAWRAELRRLRGFDTRYGWSLSDGPQSDTLPNTPRVTESYQRLLEETDFWVTDEHDDDNTRQGLIDIADGADVLMRYSADVMRLVEQMNEAPAELKRKFGERAIMTSQVYDRELQRWLAIVASADADVTRRLRVARLRSQLRRAINIMPKGTNPPALPPISYSGTGASSA